MFREIHKKLMPTGRRRRRAIEEARRQIASCGYDLEDVTDSQLETAMTINDRAVEDISPLTAKTIFWTLRRVPPGVKQLKQRQVRRENSQIISTQL